MDIGLELMVMVLLAVTVLPLLYRARFGYWPPSIDDLGGPALMLSYGACYLLSLPLGFAIIYASSDQGIVPAWTHHTMTAIKILRITVPVIICATISLRRA